MQAQPAYPDDDVGVVRARTDARLLVQDLPVAADQRVMQQVALRGPRLDEVGDAEQSVAARDRHRCHARAAMEERRPLEDRRRALTPREAGRQHLVAEQVTKRGRQCLRFADGSWNGSGRRDGDQVLDHGDQFAARIQRGLDVNAVDLEIADPLLEPEVRDAGRGLLRCHQGERRHRGAAVSARPQIRLEGRNGGGARGGQWLGGGCPIDSRDSRGVGLSLGG